PAPVRTTQRIPSASAAEKASRSAIRAGPSTALRRASFRISTRRTPSMGSRTESVAEPMETSADDGEDVALLHGIALLAPDLLDGPGARRLDRHLHLHGLEDDDHVALGDGVALSLLDLPNGSSDVRRDFDGHAVRTLGERSGALLYQLGEKVRIQLTGPEGVALQDPAMERQV